MIADTSKLHPTDRHGGDQDGPPIDAFRIPEGINTFDKHRAAKFYFEKLGWAVQPLNAPDKGDEPEKGKKPLLKGWKSHTTAEIEPEFFDEYFSRASTNNVGCVVRAPWVVVDLDSKPDKGESVRKWLEDQPELAAVPRERTGGGAHLHFMCGDMPKEVLEAGEPLTVKINGTVQAELFSDGLNIALSPSMHKSGHRYTWEVTGDFIEVGWVDLCRWFGFETPPAKRGPGRPRKDPPWWAKYPEDLVTFDIVAALEELEVQIRLVDERKAMWAVRCPWADQHSAEPGATPGTDTVVFVRAGKVPAFDCKHAHCADRKLRELVEWMEGKKPGILAAHCTRLREWSTGGTDDSGRPEIVGSGPGRPDSVFAAELGEAIAAEHSMFRRADDIVEVHTESSGEIEVAHFQVLSPKEFVTSIEDSVQVGFLADDESGTPTFVPKSLSEKSARVILASSHFRKTLPRIDRILDTSVPMLGTTGEIVYPETGYDPEFRTWLDTGAPKIQSMELEEAIRLLDDVLAGAEQGGFWWKDNQSRTHALARLLTPFVRGLMNWEKAPVFIIAGNAPGIGKDTFASLVQVVHTGRESIGAPLGKHNDDELRKRITSMLRAGARQIHFANLKGDIDFPSLEAATDNSGIWEDRELGRTRQLKLRNEAEYSLSSNNATWTPDLERRSRCIFLHCRLDQPDRHRYRHSDLLSMIRRNRSIVLSALAALVRYWDEQGRPEGPSVLTSFPRWGRVVGGILTACGYPDPCLPQKPGPVSGDQQTAAMRQFFQIAVEKFGDRSVPKKAFLDSIKGDEAIHDLFTDIDFTTRGGLSKFGKLILSFCDRSLGGITLHYAQASKNRGHYRFTQVRVSAAENRGGDEEGRRGGDPASMDAAENNSVDDGGAGDFNSLVPSRDENVPHVPAIPRKSPVVFCKTVMSLREMAGELRSSRKVVACLSPLSPTLGYETDPNREPIHQLSIQGCPDGAVWVIDDRDAKLLSPIQMALQLTICFSNKPVVALDGISLQQWVTERFGVEFANFRCLRTAARLLENGNDVTLDLDSILRRENIENDTSGNVGGNRLRLEIPDPLERQVDERVYRLLQLYKALEERIADNGLADVWRLENRLIPVVARMAATGIGVSIDKLEGLSERGDKEAERLLPFVDQDDRIRSNFDPIGQRTGRFTSAHPCLHNVSRGAVRGAFRPSPGNVFISADYCQHDLRVLASVANDEAMIQCLLNGDDPHAQAAAAIFGKSLSEVNEEERKVGKTIIFATIFGQTPEGMVQTGEEMFGVDISHLEQKQQAFFEAHPGFAQWMKRCRVIAARAGREVRTRIGRRRFIPPEVKDGKRQRILMNTPIQGGAADAFKEAMILVHERLPEDARIVHCIHDEIIVECPRGSAKAVAEIVGRSMVEAMSKMFPEVKAGVDLSIGEFWGDEEQSWQYPAKESA